MWLPDARGWTLALVVLAAAVAGCAGDDGGLDPDPISAQEAVEEARPTVDEWNEDAVLLAASGFEGGQDSPAFAQQRAEESSFPLYEDSLPGDGRAPQWTMIFLADNETRTIRVNSEEVTWMDEEGQEAGPRARPPTGWSLDSTEALDAARNATASLDAIVAASDASIFVTLGNVSGGPHWQLRANSHSLDERADLWIDARTGEVSNRSEAEPEPRTEDFEGTLDRQQRNGTHPIFPTENETRVSLELTWDADTGAQLGVSLNEEGRSLEPDRIQRGDGVVQANWKGLDAEELWIDVGAESLGEEEQIAYELTAEIR